jgi:drug/metabolite transporter (DMT)-like permease
MVMALLARVFTSVGIYILINLCFYFYALSGSHVNSGIIVTLWSTNVMFTSIFFYFVYHQKLTSGQIFGMLLIVVGVVLVAMSKNEQRETLTFQMRKSNMFYFGFAILFGIITGMSLTI